MLFSRRAVVKTLKRSSKVDEVEISGQTCLSLAHCVIQVEVGKRDYERWHMEETFLVSVAAIGEEYRDAAEKDIRVLASIAAGVAEGLELPFLLQEIRLTERLQEDANEIYRQERGSLGEYSARRDDVFAYAKTIWALSQDGEVRFVVLIDLRCISPWNFNNPWFLVAVLHELGHVVYETQALKRLGQEDYVSFELSRESLLGGISKTIIDEYKVDRLVDWILKEFITDDTGNPYSLHKVEEEVKEMDWAGSLVSALEKLPQRIDEMVYRYKTGQIGINELRNNAPSLVQDVLVLFSHTCALYLGTDSWTDIDEKLKETEASRRFLGGHIEAIAEALSNDELTIEDTLEEVAYAIECIFRSCGLTFEDSPEGLYTAVNWPTQ